jgi:hypothetical protein
LDVVPPGKLISMVTELAGGIVTGLRGAVVYVPVYVKVMGK